MEDLSFEGTLFDIIKKLDKLFKKIKIEHPEYYDIYIEENNWYDYRQWDLYAKRMETDKEYNARKEREFDGRQKEIAKLKERAKELGFKMEKEI